MTKRETKSLKVGDRVQQKHTVWQYTVVERMDTHEDPHAVVPIFKCRRIADNTIHDITYRLLVKI